jgi:hypothetical protein
MQRPQVLEIARALHLGKPKPSGRGAKWVNFSCPFAKWKHTKKDVSGSFGIKCDDGRSHYFCFACHSTGTLANLAYELGTLRGHDYINLGHEIERQEIVGPDLIFPEWDSQAPVEKEDAQEIVFPDPKREFEFPLAAGHPYLAERGISVSTAIRLGLRFDPRQRRVLFPVYSPTGRFAGFTGRRIDGPFRHDEEGTAFEKSGDPYIKVRDYFGLPKRQLLLASPRYYGNRNGAANSYGVFRRTGSRYSQRSRGIICEGPFDFAAIVELSTPLAFCNLGQWCTPEKGAILANLNLPLVIFFDNDKGGKQGRDVLVELLWGKIPLLDVTYPEGYEGADPSSLPPDVRRQMIRDAQLILKRFG